MVSPFFTFAYAPETTHKALTQEIIKVFNAYYPNLKIGAVDASFVGVGSIAEDDGLRALHHFYDPVYGRGLSGQISAKDWAENTIAQAGVFRPFAGAITGIFGSPTDYSWDRAVYDYVWVDRSRGLDGLGHILHLIEDMSVPDHTRNDAHPPYADKIFHQASPYEHWADKWNTETISGLSTMIYHSGSKPPLFSSLREYFDSIATYSNNNFFSKDTTPDKDKTYSKPLNGKIVKEKLSNGDNVQFVLHALDQYRLAQVKFDIFSNKKTYFIEDKDNLVLTDYWTHLSKQAVLHGVGVVRLFFEEAEKERQSKKLLAKNQSLFEKVAGVLPAGLASAVGISREEPTTLVDEIPASAFTLAELPRPSTPLRSSTPAESPADIQASAPEDLTSDVLPSVGVVVQTSISERGEVVPGFALGGGGAGAGGGGASSDKNPPSSPFLELPKEHSKIFTTTSINFEGVGEPQSVVTNNVNSQNGTVGEDGKWSVTLKDLPQGTTTIQFLARDKAGNVSELSDKAERVVFVDSIAPVVTLAISDCNQSVSPDSCLVPLGDISLNWSTTAGDLDNYIIECSVGGAECGGFPTQSTTTISTNYTLPTADSLYTFKVKAKDRYGNIGDEVSKTIEFVSNPIVINEVAWAGTIANSADEWIELYNRSSKTIDLSGFKLKSQTDNKPNINLSGTMSSGSYYLIERTDDNTVSDIAADLTASFGSGGGGGAGLANESSEVLAIEYKGTTIDQTPNCGTNWSSCGGSASGNKPSMERVDPDIAGTLTSNWGTSNGLVKNGKDVAGTDLTATPRARNSLHYLISQNSTLSADRTLKKSFGTYIIKPGENFTVPAGKTLTIEPGVTVKMGGDAKLRVDGALFADGTAENRILFTTLDAAPWSNVKITSSSANSSISYANFTGGGKFYSNTPTEERALFSAISSSPAISNSVFENSISAGLKLTNSNANVSGNTFSAGTSTADRIGVYVTGGAPTISGNTFLNNDVGLSMMGSSAAVSSNAFTNNISYAANSTNGTAAFSGNSGSGNGKNGIALFGTISIASGTTTIFANSLPYLMGEYPSYNPKVAAGSAAVIETGAVWKGEVPDSRFVVEGTLKLEGVGKNGILFTSVADSAPQEWYAMTVSSTGYLYGGGFTLRYAGKGVAACQDCAGIFINGGRANLSDARIEKNYKAGIRIYNSATTTFSNFEFIDHNTPSDAVALVAVNSDIILKGAVFSGNAFNTSKTNSVIIEE